MTTRHRDTVLLLGSIDPDGASWYDPVPETSTGNLVRQQAEPGEAATERVHCPVCWTNDLRMPLGMVQARSWHGGPLVWTPCAVCGGDVDEGRPGSGWVEIDGMTERRIGDKRTHLETGLRTVPCDVAGCDRGTVTAGPWRGENDRCLNCSGSGVVEMTESQWRSARSRLSAEAANYGAGGDPVAAAIDRRDALGSYWELGLALGALRLELPRAYRTVVRVYIERSVSLNGAAETRLAHDVGLAYVVRLMPEPILVPPAVRAVERRRCFEERQERRRGKERAA